MGDANGIFSRPFCRCKSFEEISLCQACMGRVVLWRLAGLAAPLSVAAAEEIDPSSLAQSVTISSRRVGRAAYRRGDG